MLRRTTEHVLMSRLDTAFLRLYSEEYPDKAQLNGMSCRIIANSGGFHYFE
jgi:hypothetical protein